MMNPTINFRQKNKYIITQKEKRQNIKQQFKKLFICLYFLFIKKLIIF